MSALVIAVAPPGAGKTTWIRKRFTDTQRTSLDDQRAALTDDPSDQTATTEAVAIQHAILAGRCRRRLLTVVDNTNIDPAHRAAVLAHAERNFMFRVAVIFDTPPELCRYRNTTRDRVVPEPVVDRMWANFSVNIPTTGPLPGVDQTIRVSPDWSFVVFGQTPQQFQGGAPWLR